MNIGKETEQIEFKKSTGELKEGVISIASMLNKHGSCELYFGVKNDGETIGQQIGNDTLREISQAIANFIKPQIIGSRCRCVPHPRRPSPMPAASPPVRRYWASSQCPAAGAPSRRLPVPAAPTSDPDLRNAPG